MATRKKMTTESGARTQEESSQAAQPATIRKFRTSTSAAAAAGTEKPAKASSPAATHKAPTRKSIVHDIPETHAAVAGAAFDSGNHHEEISREAYFNWLRRGCPDGTAHEDWEVAVESVRTRYAR